MGTPAVAPDYKRDGFVFPLDAMSEARARDYRTRLEELETAQGDNPDFIYAVNGGINFVVPLIDEITCRTDILDRVEEILGRDIIVFGASLFTKEPRSKYYISWHQDLTYWGMGGTDEVTAWVALSPATVASGCMRMVPGSHRRELVSHRDTFHEDNLLTRGQEIAVPVDERDAMDIVLRPGQFSLHHGHTYHASHANRSDDRRIGISINYISPTMSVRGGTKPMVRLVRGQDEYGHFELVAPPRGVMDARDIEQLRAAKAIAESFYYEGTDRRLATDAVGQVAAIEDRTPSR